MTYNPNIPQATDALPVSQVDLLNNFGQINEKYGTSGDHYAFDNNNASETNMHAKVTMPRLPTATAPGDVVPTPAANIGSVYCKAAVSQTIPYYRKDGTVIDWPMLPIRAMGRFEITGNTAIGTPFNLSIAAGGNSLERNFSFSSEQMPDTNYIVILTATSTSTGNNVLVVEDGTQQTTGFTVKVDTTNRWKEINVIVLHYA